MNRTKIEWTHRPESGGAAGGFTWNPIRARRIDGEKAATKVRDHGTACTKISPGCANCYAEMLNERFGTGLEFTVPNLAKIEFFLDDAELAAPIRRKKPATIFVGDMFDLFHESIPGEMIAEVLRVAMKCERHTFQFLTKRAERMRMLVNSAQSHWERKFGCHMWFGVSVESQKYADERIPELLKTEAEVRFLSVEPMLEAIRFTRAHQYCPEHDFDSGFCTEYHDGLRFVDWVICGGESGPGARAFRAEWAMDLLDQCNAASIPFFMKQMGSYAILDPRYDQTLPGASRKLADRKGGDPEEWPEKLRVREWPR